MLDDVVKLKEGSVVPLDKLAGDPVDVLVNGRLIARGEVLVLNENFCVRVSEIIGTFQNSDSSAAASEVLRARGPITAITLSSSTSSLKTLRVVCGFSLESRSTNSNSGRTPLVLTVFSVFSEAGLG